MRPERIQALLRTRPFRPLRICTTDGAKFEVRHPEQVIVSHWDVFIGLEPDPATGLWNRIEICSPLHIVRVERIRSPRLPRAE